MRMRTTPGMIFLLGLFVAGVGLLAGGQIWAYTGLLWFGALIGVLVSLLLTVALRALAKRVKLGGNVNLVGELQGLDERDFVDVVSQKENSRASIEKEVETRPDNVADSIRTMLHRNRS